MNWWQRFLAFFIGKPTVVQNVPLHEKFPNILEWREHDHFDLRTYARTKRTQYNLISLSADGYVYVQFLGDKEKFPLEFFYNNFDNTTLRNRRIDKELRNSVGYMKLLSNFQNSVAELERRDKEMLGDSVTDYMDKAYNEAKALNS